MSGGPARAEGVGGRGRSSSASCCGPATRPGLRQDPWADPLAQPRSHWVRVLAAGALSLVVIAAREALPASWLPAAAAVIAPAAGALCAWTLLAAARPRA